MNDTFPIIETGSGVSKIDELLLEMAEDAELQIAAPYVDVLYLHRLVARSRGWKLLTDLNNLDKPAFSFRPKKLQRDFVSDFFIRIKSTGGLTTNLVIGEQMAIMGVELSARSVTRGTNLAMATTNSESILQLKNWYEEKYQAAAHVDYESLQKDTPLLMLHRNSVGMDLSEDGVPIHAEVLKLSDARGYEHDGAFVVLRGSTAMLHDHSLARYNERGKTSLVKLKQDLIKDGILKPKGARLVFTRDYAFTSKSAASSLIMARPTDGRIEWKQLTFN